MLIHFSNYLIKSNYKNKNQRDNLHLVFVENLLVIYRIDAYSNVRKIYINDYDERWRKEKENMHKQLSMLLLSTDDNICIKVCHPWLIALLIEIELFNSIYI